MTNSVNPSWLTTEKSDAVLDPRQQKMYRHHRRELLTWLLNQGKNPEVGEGYASNTVKTRSKRLDKFYRWVWRKEGQYTENIKPAHADAYTKHLYERDLSESYKAGFQKAIKMMFKWRRYTQGDDLEWDPVYEFRDHGAPSIRGALTKEERKQLREAALEEGHIPHYNSLNRSERSEWKSYISQRLGKPKSEVGKSDWSRICSWKMTSLFWTALDAGLRPAEVSRAKVSWVDREHGVLNVPPEDAVKNSLSWDVGLKDRTVEILDGWIEERSHYEKYSDSELLWLTREGNPYTNQSLGYWFRKMCDRAGIEDKGRDLSWYSMRHSVGREMVKEMDIGAAAAQLRHKSLRSTLRYTRPTAEERKDALDRMG